MANRSIILHRVGNFHGKYPANFYFYFKIVGDCPRRNTNYNCAFLLANILMDNAEYITEIYDANTGHITTDKASETFQNFRKWVENYGSSRNSFISGRRLSWRISYQFLLLLENYWGYRTSKR